MSVHPCRHRLAASLAGLSLGLISVAGCGGSNSNQTTKTIFKSPDEVAQKKMDLQEAMKGGAYGSAGRTAAPNMKP